MTNNGSMTPAEWLAEVQRRISISEGCRSSRYYDSLGIPTIGVGFNLQRPDAAVALAHCGCPNPHAAIAGDLALSAPQVAGLFAYSFAPTIANARASLTHFDKLNDARRFVIVDLVFNLGPAGWDGFQMTRTLIDAAVVASETDTTRGHTLYGQAARNLELSEWYQQVKDRAKRNVAMIRGGLWVSATGDGSH